MWSSGKPQISGVGAGGVGLSVRSALFFAWCGSCAGGVACWADAVAGCAGTRVHRSVVERVMYGCWPWGPRHDGKMGHVGRITSRGGPRVSIRRVKSCSIKCPL